MGEGSKVNGVHGNKDGGGEQMRFRTNERVEQTRVININILGSRYIGIGDLTTNPQGLEYPTL